MNPLLVGAIVCALLLGGTIFGIALGRIMPEHHFSEQAQDVIKVAMAMVATLAALVLGLMIASAQSSLDDKEEDVRNAAARILLLDRTLTEYGPEGRELRGMLKDVLSARIGEVWLEENESMGQAKQSVATDTDIDDLQSRILKLAPQTDAQRWLQSTALAATNDMAAAHWANFEQLDSHIQRPFLLVLVFWLVAVFASFGLFAPRSSMVIGALLVAAFSVAGSIYLLLEMDQPYTGAIKLSSAPLRKALERLDRE